MERFPILALILRFGKTGAIAASVIVAMSVGWLLFPSIGWLAVIPAVLVAGILLIVVLSYIELIRLITEMLMPQ